MDKTGDFVSGYPVESGLYIFKNRYGDVRVGEYKRTGRDSGFWLEAANDGSVLYSPNFFYSCW